MSGYALQRTIESAWNPQQSRKGGEMNKQKEYPRIGIRRCSVLILAVLLLTLSTVQAAPPEPYLVKDTNPRPGNSSPFDLTEVNGMLFFRAVDSSHGSELWKSDGTEAGTVRIKDIYPGTGSSLPGDGELTNVNGTLFFRADDGSSGWELWKSDGTEAGTVRVKDIYPGSGSSELHYLTNVNGTLFFSADDGSHGSELWALIAGYQVYLPLVLRQSNG